LVFHCLQHVPFEGPVLLESWAQQSGFAVKRSHLYKGDSFPEIESVDFLGILGGPMNVYEDKKYPWLKKEKKFIEKILKTKKKVIGVCLGAQLLAVVLGSRVFQNTYKEIGWFPVALDPAAKPLPILSGIPASFLAFHWHGDTFDLPKQAKHLLRSHACFEQGFLYHNHVLGLQCHLEISRPSVTSLVKNCKADLGGGPFVQGPGLLLNPAGKFLKLKRIFNQWMDNFYNI